MPKGRCFIGTSGWSYKHWRGPFYPSAMGKGADQLRFYAERFDTVEVNGTFYRLIEVETFRRWREQTPPQLRVRLQGQPLSHAHEAPQGRRAGRRALLRAGRGARGKARPDRVPAARPVQTGSRAPRGLHRRAPGRAPLRLRVPRSRLVPARDLRSARQARRRALPVRVRRSGGAARGHRRASSTSACTAPRAPTRARTATRRCAPGPSASAAGPAKGLDVYCYFDNDDRGFAPQNALRLREMLASTVATARPGSQDGMTLVVAEGVRPAALRAQHSRRHEILDHPHVSTLASAASARTEPRFLP